MENEEYSLLAKREFRKDPELIALTFDYDGSIKHRWYVFPVLDQQTMPVHIFRRNSKRVYWNNFAHNFQHVYIDTIYQYETLSA